MITVKFKLTLMAMYRHCPSSSIHSKMCVHFDTRDFGTLMRGFWRHRRHGQRYRWYSEIQISREINSKTRKAHWTTKSIRCPLLVRREEKNNSMQKKDWSVEQDKRGDLRETASSNGWRALLNYITTSVGTFKVSYK